MTRRLNLRQLEAFRAVMLSGSFTKAARSMHVTQPAVSSLIADLEDSLGIRLFHRQRGKAVPSESAMRIYDEFATIHAGLGRLVEIASSLSTHHRAIIKIGALPVYADTLAPPLVAQYCRADAQVLCTLETLNHDELLNALLLEHIDIGLTLATDGIAAFRQDALATHSAVVVVPRGHRLASREEASLSDLAGEPFIALPPTSPFRQSLDALFAANSFRPNLVMQARTQNSICELIRLQAGVSVLNGVIAARGCEQLAIVPLREKLEWRCAIVARAARSLPAHVQRFLDAALKHEALK